MLRQAHSAATQQRRLAAAVAELQQQVRGTFAACAADDSLAAVITCVLPVVDQRREDFIACSSWLRCSATAGMQNALDHVQQILLAPWPADLKSAVSNVAAAASQQPSALWSLYELLLGTGDDRSRRATGAFYTPPQIAHYLVADVDRQLREQLALPLGIGDPNLTLLEPACGCGEFVSALLESVQRQPAADLANFLPRLIAIDISPVAIFLTKLRIAFNLQDYGLDVNANFPQPQLVLGNALAGPTEIAALKQPIAVVIGNPPFSSLSTNEQPWIQTLIRGDKDNAGYFAIDEQQLGEKKTWLHDDYVKFMRLAQWCIEQNGTGVVSLVTNHGWLDNATFRIARQQLLRTFTQIDVVDLHGNAKRHEVNPSGERDENVFGIGQGIALVTLTKTSANSSTTVSHADLWGSRQKKLNCLEQATNGEGLPSQPIIPAAPWFTFAVQNETIPPEYLSAPLLTELMPVNSTVPVTARDHFVVARTPAELLARLQSFCDFTISDEAIRAEYFNRTRSNRYAAGDTRSWKLSEARRIVRDAGDLQPFIRRCLYRPFVWRYIFWHPAMIDWPRTEFTRHFDGGNLALLARRQSIAGREANFFWITDCLPLDGVIRSDNRGSESFFPLNANQAGSHIERVSNFSPEFHAHPPEEMLAYIYALFHSPTYRTRYAQGLGMEFPRVLMPADETLFAELVKIGLRLIELHLTDPQSECKLLDLQSEIRNPQSVEAFHVGTYNVCRKWLQMEESNRESPAFARLQQLIAETIDWQRNIDAAILAAGGFPTAFRAS
jgi:predicted helicase